MGEEIVNEPTSHVLLKKLMLTDKKMAIGKMRRKGKTGQ